MKIRILGIETSCDETSIAIVGEDKRIYAQATFSQIEGHKIYGGVVPELGARAHIQKITPLVHEVMERSGLTFGDLTGIAATCGPGLIGGVVVGAMFGKGLAASLNLPFFAINHLEGHALTARLSHEVDFPFLLLLVSGGHCQFLEATKLGKYTLLGETLDDALGEAFDKVARMLDLDYPGGPKIEALAKKGNPKIVRFPRPLLGVEGCNFSFSGLKTAVRQYIAKHPNTSKEDIAASFQAAVIEILKDRAKHAFGIFKNPVNAFVLGGGVAANEAICGALTELATTYHVPLIAPPLALCTDNAAMIAWVAVEKVKEAQATQAEERKMEENTESMSFEPRPRWPLWEV